MTDSNGSDEPKQTISFQIVVGMFEIIGVIFGIIAMLLGDRLLLSDYIRFGLSVVVITISSFAFLLTFFISIKSKRKPTIWYHILSIVAIAGFVWILASYIPRPNAITNWKEISATPTTISTTPMNYLPTETKVFLTPTEYIYDQDISIGYIGHGTDDNPKIKEILSSLGFSVGKVFLDYYDENDDLKFYNDLLKYDVIYFPAGWSRYNFEISDFRNAFIQYISSGHGIFVQEADYEGELTTVFLPFDLKFINSDPRYQDLEAEILDTDHYIFGNLADKTFFFIPGDAISNYNDDFVVLAQGNTTQQPSLLLAQNNRGRIIVFLADITQLEEDNQNSTFIKNMFNWLNGGVE